MRTLHLDKLKEGLPGITKTYGAFLAEAAAVCLTAMNHQPGVRLAVRGDFEEDFLIEWTQEIGTEELTTWGDLKEAAEYAAMAIAILLMQSLAGFQTFVRLGQGDLGDFATWKERNLTQLSLTESRLEVSGILTSVPGNSISMRIREKKGWLAKLPVQNLPVYIAVVEFSLPKAKIIVK